MQAKEITNLLKWQTVASLREAVKEGLDVALYHTVQDSSNAAFHWQVGISPRIAVPASTALGRRVNNFKGGGGPVGERGDRGASRNAVRAAVMQREIEEIVNQRIKGNNPPTAIYLYNVVGELSKTPPSGLPYSVNANIEIAGSLAVRAMVERFSENFKQGKVLKRRRK